MRSLSLCVAVMAGQIAVVVGLYYLRIVGYHSSVETDFTVFYAPTILAFAIYISALRPSSPSRLIGATAMSLLGLAFAMLISLTSFGS